MNHTPIEHSKEDAQLPQSHDEEQNASLSDKEKYVVSEEIVKN